MVLMCDPPSGWKYGFPKECPEHLRDTADETEFWDWLVEQGYPEKLLNELGLKYIRFWRTDQSDFMVT